MKRYRVDFYDAFDGWIHTDSYEFDDKDEAIAVCQEKMMGQNYGMGEHWGVIDKKFNYEVYCGRGAAK